MHIKRFNQSGGVSSHYIDVGDFRFIMYSPCRLKENDLIDTPVEVVNQQLIDEVSKYLKMRISDSDLEFFKN